MYHSSLTQSTKALVQERFKSGSELRCLSATVAFGMGMDIPDVELIIIYGIPDTMSQFYQLCGRADRAGSQSRAHLLLTTDANKMTDLALKSFCLEKENCLRGCMMRALGGSAGQNAMCCSVCNPNAFLDGGRLDILRLGRVTRKKRRVAVRKIGDSLASVIKVKLKRERAEYMAAHPTLGILGKQFVCPDSVINNVCSSAKFISEIEDMDLFCLREELKDQFFHVIVNS